MTEPSFTNREIDAKLKTQTEEMKTFMADLILPLTAQVTKTNGRVTKMERNILIVSVAVVTLVFAKYPDLLSLIGLIF